MKRLVYALGVLGMIACSGSDLTGGSKTAPGTGAKKDKTSSDVSNSDDPEKTSGGPVLDQKKQQNIQLGFIAKDGKIYVPVGKDVPINGAVGSGCKAANETIISCTGDNKAVTGVKPGETMVTVQTPKGAQEVPVVVYDPASPSSGVVDQASDAAAQSVGVTDDSLANGQSPGNIDVSDNAITKTQDPAFGGVYRDYGYNNPYTGGLSCPAGYTASLIHELTDGNCALYNRGNGGPCRVSLYSCYKGGNLSDNTAGFFRTSTNGPQIPNPYTNGTSCPAGFREISLLDFSSDNGLYYSDGVNRGLVIVKYCAKATFGAGNSGGFYRNDKKDGVNRCTSPNPFTGSCSCPAGYNAAPFNEFTAPNYYEGWGIELFSCNK